jgi:hypothetical protein
LVAGVLVFGVINALSKYITEQSKIVFLSKMECVSAFKFLQKGRDFCLPRISNCRMRAKNGKLICSHTLYAFKIKAANVLYIVRLVLFARSV